MATDGRNKPLEQARSNIRDHMEFHRVVFSGSVLERGFWLYVWRIQHANGQLFYVGRTGDSSSQYAASPFSRLSQHLDIRQSATANMLMRHLRKEGLNPLACDFEMAAIGPLFPEQASLEEHRIYRDKTAYLETALAAHLRMYGTVLGKHPSPGHHDVELFEYVCSKLEDVIKGWNTATPIIIGETKAADSSLDPKGQKTEGK